MRWVVAVEGQQSGLGNGGAARQQRAETSDCRSETPAFGVSVVRRGAGTRARGQGFLARWDSDDFASVALAKACRLARDLLASGQERRSRVLQQRWIAVRQGATVLG
ncbi:hypothetical protein ACJRO7_027355 [Eucalyptus globulus]|uniref:Uncharacterized protein n=1 Tax=Eucalyptus globulus TaxID=34317 RepID=A0ABD3JVX2_EUCGL